MRIAAIEGLIMSAVIATGLLMSACARHSDDQYWAGVAKGLQQVEKDASEITWWLYLLDMQTVVSSILT